MTSREKFESWYLENWGHTEDDHETLFERDPDSDEDYYRLGVRLAHDAWQAAELASEQKLTDMAVQLANAESKCRELAAENSTIKVMNDCLSEELRAYESDGSFEGPEMHLLWWKVETQTTDAFLAEVRAQGVDIARNAMIDFVDGEIGPNENVPGLIRGAEICVSISSQLRIGAAL